MVAYDWKIPESEYASQWLRNDSKGPRRIGDIETIPRSTYDAVSVICLYPVERYEALTRNVGST